MKYYTKEDDEIVKQLTLEGWYAKDIAEVLGRTRISVNRRKLLIGARRDPDRWTKEQLIEIFEASPNKTHDYFRDRAEAPKAFQYLKIWGSWSNLLEDLGYPANLAGYSSLAPTHLYLVKFSHFYKVGITQRSVKARLKDHSGCYEVLFDEVYSLAEAKRLEGLVLEYMRDNLYVPDNFGDGKTECFKAEPCEVQEVLSILKL